MIFRKASQVIPLATTFLLVMSIVYDYFYIKSLGLNFHELPTSISDHVRSSIVWIGGVAYYLCLFFLYRIFKNVFSNKNKIVLGSAVGVLIGLFVYLLYISYSIYDWETVFAVVFFIISFLIFLFFEELDEMFFRDLVVFEGCKPSKYLLLLFAMTTLVASYGWFDGREMLNSKINKVTVQVRTEAGIESLEKIGVRSFENIVLIIGLNNQVEVLRSEDVISVKHKVTRGKS